MRDEVRMILSLTLVALTATLLLAFIDQLTREPIAAAERETLLRALNQVLPEHGNDPMQDQMRLQEADHSYQVYPARDRQGHTLAVAWETTATDGYNGKIKILLGVLADGSLYAIRIISHKETPGLGDAITTDQQWLDSFIGRTLAKTHWAVRKDGGDFDQFTGATITPRAVIKAVNKALKRFETRKELWFSQGSAP
ncbi:MAG: RnfABCDGE type electron transport complex subunit G [Mariprofundaceae bacterium]